MKKLTFEDLVGGLELLKVKISFDEETGLSVTRSKTKVNRTRPHVRPANGCDILIGDFSCNSKSVFEIGETRHMCELKNCGYHLKQWGQVNTHFYCLPESFEEAVKVVSKELSKGIRKVARELEQKAEEINRVLDQQEQKSHEL